MQISSALNRPGNAMPIDPMQWQRAEAPVMPETTDEADSGELRRAFDSFVGETFYGQMLKSMRKTVGKPAYFHGGRAEEVFQGQLDQILAEEMTEASASTFTGPMYELFNLSRS